MKINAANVKGSRRMGVSDVSIIRGVDFFFQAEDGIRDVRT